MYTNFMIIADSAHIDSDGKLHIQGIFEFIKSPTFPCVHNSMSLVVQIESTEKNIGPFTPTFQIKNSKNEIINNFNMPPFKFAKSPKKGEAVRKNLHITFKTIQFNEPGAYTLHLLIDNRYLNSTKFNLIKIPVIRGGARA